MILHERLAFYSAFLNIHRSGVLTALFDCYVTGATWNCCHLGAFCLRCTTMHHVTSLHANPHTYGACVFSCNLPPALLAEWPGSFTCHCGNTGLERIPEWESAQKVDSGEENSPAAPAGLEPDTFRSRVRHSNHWAIPAPQLYCYVKRNAINSHNYPSHVSRVSWRSLPNTNQTLGLHRCIASSQTTSACTLNHSVHANRVISLEEAHKHLQLGEVTVNLLFYDCHECVMNVLGTTKQSSCTLHWHLAIQFLKFIVCERVWPSGKLL